MNKLKGVIGNVPTLKREQGAKTITGYTPQKNIDYFDGEPGKPGEDGKSAYQIWLDAGNTGSEADFLESLRGDDYVLTEADKADIAQQAAELVEIPDIDIPQGVATEKYVQEYAQPKGEYLTEEDIPDSLPASDVYEWAKQPNKPSYTKSDVGLSDVDNARQYSAINPPPYPVTTVNGQTGNVSIKAEDVQARPVTWTPTAEDVGALSKNTFIPTKTSDITNDSGFITKTVNDLTNYYTKNQTYTRTEIDNKVSEIPKFAITVVSTLPTTNISETTVYLLIGGDGSNLYTEYLFVNGKWEILGSQQVDLTGYATESWVNIKLADYLPTSELTAAINTALAQAKASGEFKGEQGPKGDKGDTGLQGIQGVKGDTGATGEKGADGKTPVRGVDYWTDADKAEIKSYVDDAILRGEW